MSARSDPDQSRRQPTRALVLAQALERCVQAERRQAGSAEDIIAHQPAWARAELRRLVALARSLEATAAGVVLSEDFRVSTRARLMRAIARESEVPHQAPTGGGLISTFPSRQGQGRLPARRRSRWLWRGGLGGLLAATLTVGATLSASASALPGEPLYQVKQLHEELRVRLATDDQSRALALLARANARLDETARLLDEGRTAQAAETAQRFDDVLDRATTTYVVTIAASAAENPTTSHMESQLSQEQAQLQTMLDTAPEPARADLRQALVATERSRALVANPQPIETALGHPPGRAAGTSTAPVPTMAVEAPATDVPQLAKSSAPPPIDPAAQAHEPTHASAGVESDEQAVPSPSESASASPGASASHAPARRGPPASPDKSREDASVRAPQPPAIAEVQSQGEDSHQGTHAVGNGEAQGQATRPIMVAQPPAAEDHGGSASSNQGDAHDRVAAPEPPPQQPAQVQTAREADPSVSALAGSHAFGTGASRSSSPPEPPASLSQPAQTTSVSPPVQTTSASSRATATPSPADRHTESTSESSNGNRSSGGNGNNGGNGNGTSNGNGAGNGNARGH